MAKNENIHMEIMNQNSLITRIKSIQIIKIEGTKFTFDFEAFKSIVDKNEKCKNLPVSVVIINGALRSGKSFFSNFIIRHLKNLNKNNDSSNSEYLTDYFVSRRGTNVQTLGVWALDEIFIYDGKAIVLMDTQGIFDQELNQSMTIALISLSTIVSSYQIYNLDKRIHEDHLCNMAYFSAYSSLVKNTDNTKIGQTLCLLVRDWPNFDNSFDLARCDAETELYKRDFLENINSMDKVKIDTRKKIFNTYDNVIVRLCPHPGHIVTEGKFSGKMTEIREDFKIHVEHIIGMMLKDLNPKKIGKSQILLCSELPYYLKEYVTLYDNVKNSLPAAMTLLETSEKICQDNAKTKTLHFYRDHMLSRIRTRVMTKEDIDAWHNNCMRESQKYFNKLYIMGKDDAIKQIRENIMKDIESEHCQYLSLAKEKTVFYVIFVSIVNFLKKFNLNFDVLSEAFLKNSFLVLGIAYVFTMFLPLGADLISSVIKYAVCILGGIYLCVFVRDQKNNEQLYHELLHDLKIKHEKRIILDK